MCGEGEGCLWSVFGIMVVRGVDVVMVWGCGGVKVCVCGGGYGI